MCENKKLAVGHIKPFNQVKTGMYGLLNGENGHVLKAGTVYDLIRENAISREMLDELLQATDSSQPLDLELVRVRLDTDPEGHSSWYYYGDEGFYIPELNWDNARLKYLILDGFIYWSRNKGVRSKADLIEKITDDIYQVLDHELDLEFSGDDIEGKLYDIWDELTQRDVFNTLETKFSELLTELSK